jgi:hypothetical protein
MTTKQEALALAKQQNVKVVKLGVDYQVNGIEITYSGYGNNFKIQGENFARNLGDAIVKCLNNN